MTSIKYKNGDSWTEINCIDLGAYPVGSVYMSYDSTSPASIFSGTSWTQITGYYLRAANDNNTGGSSSFTIGSANLPKHTHTYDKVNSPTGGTAITIANLPSNYASFTVRKVYNGANTWYAGALDGSHATIGNDNRTDVAPLDFYASSGATSGTKVTLTGSGSQHTHTTSTTSTNSGNGSFANNAISYNPTYQDLYVWRRVS